MGKPPLFEAANVDLDEAMARAAAEGSWLFVVVTSSSSEPCALMDRATWSDERVTTAIADKGLAIQVDVDAEPELGKRLRVDAVPALIAFKGSEEKDRMEGFRQSAQVLMWLTGLGRKRTDLDRMVRGTSADLDRDMNGRMSFAEALQEAGRFDEATEHFVWLWDNITRVEPDMSGVRVSFMAGHIEKLVGAHEPARLRFAELRDRTAAAAAADPSSGDLRLDWIVLNKIVGDEDRTMSWFDGARSDPAATKVIEGVSRFLVEPLKACGRWADLGRLYRNPMAELAFQHEVTTAQVPMMPELLGTSAFEQFRAVMARQFRTAAAELFGSLRAAGRNEEAKAVREEAMRLDPSDDMKAALEQSPVRYD